MAAGGRCRIRQRPSKAPHTNRFLALCLFTTTEKARTEPKCANSSPSILAKASQIVEQLKYVTLPARAYELAMDRVKNNSFGTAFGGKPEIGVTIDALTRREPKL
ncbi:MAG: hypothetical protein ACREPG_04140 [Candidatus Binatia bacterium]